MGTRSITRIYSQTESGEKSHLVSFYRHADGYPEGHGKELADILRKGEFVSGLPPSRESRILGLYFNGAGCGAATVISVLKDEPGGIYIIPESRDNMWEEWTYEVIFNDFDKSIVMTVIDTREGTEPYFTGTPQEFFDKH
jgi:hypothetical protein